MNSRLAQIVASSIGPDGKPDRAKIYNDLQVTPDAPEAILIDAFLASDEGVRNLANIIKDAERVLTAAISGVRAGAPGATSQDTAKALTHLAEASQKFSTASARMASIALWRTFALGLVVGIFFGGLGMALFLARG